jgi:hypothetical protein
MCVQLTKMLGVHLEHPYVLLAVTVKQVLSPHVQKDISVDQKD